ncbi:MAG: DEAD/DEAH box helicase, partial [Gammaproteobacteria bacterium]|nr:DEAD/DEAH box helicase [Gammaproteobacteria bacterium]
TADKAIERPATYDDLAELINTSTEWTVGALLRLYHFQTVDEQASHSTNHQNDFGFNSFDAGILTDISQYYLTKGYLSDRQIIFVRKAIKKYINQLLNIGIEPISVTNKAPTAIPIETMMEASLLTKKDTEQPSGIQIKFSFPKGDKKFFETLADVKTLPDRRWVADEKYWRIGLSLEAGQKLKEWGFKFSEGLQKWIDGLLKPIDNLDKIWDKRLYPFQNEGVSFIESRNGRALVGDEMGLGKTAQALIWLKNHPKAYPCIVVCPASLKLNWLKEIRMWIGKNAPVQILEGRKPNGYQINQNDIIIINYDILGNATYNKSTKKWDTSGWVTELIEKKIKTIIFDEVHYAKNNHANRTKAAKALAVHCKHVLALSGTPIVNRPMEFFNPINMIRPDVFPSFWRFAQEFCGAKHNGFGWDFTGATNTDKLHKLLTNTIMVRRLKKDVLKDLPPKVRSVIPFEISNRKDYEKADTNIIEWIRDNEGNEKAEKASYAEVLVAFEKLKQLAVKGKMKASIEWISDFLESGEKLIVFATHTSTLDLLQKEFGDIGVRLDGSTSAKNRQNVVDAFQNDDSVRLFLGNVKAAGVGITLTAASNVAFMELPWTPGDASQAEDRAHRIGQADSVSIWYLIAQDTVEEIIATILSNKQKTLDAVLDGKEPDKSSILSELINQIKNK